MIKFHLFPVALAACLLAIGFFSSVACVDPLKAAEISREIREHYRQSGMNWISPRQLLEQIDLSINTKPIMYVFTLRSCQDCRTLMNEFVTEQEPMAEPADLEESLFALAQYAPCLLSSCLTPSLLAPYTDHSMLSQLSSQFLAVLVLDDYGLEPPFNGPEYAPQGFDAVPRILFASPDGKVNPSHRNPKADNYTAYNYIAAQEVVEAMRNVLKDHYSKEISLMVEASVALGSEEAKPSSRLLNEDARKGGVAQYPADLDFDLPS